MVSSRRWAALPNAISTEDNSSIIASLCEERRPEENDIVGNTNHETADSYLGVIAQFCPRHRVIVCKDAMQWILQQRKKGGAERPWRSVGYFRSRDALLRVSASFCSRIDPAAMPILLALPGQIGGAA